MTFDLANPTSSSRTRIRVGDLACMRPAGGAVDVLSKQVIEVRFDESDLADPAAARQRALDGRVHDRVDIRALREADPPLVPPVLGRGAELREEGRLRRRRGQLEPEL